MSVNVPRELIDFINSGLKFIIAGHKEPDGDCTGSQLVLCSILRRLGKEAIACSSGPFNRTEIKNYSDKFIFTIGEKERKDAKLIIVDCASTDRTGDLESQIKDLPTAIIDHHGGCSHPPNTVHAPVYFDQDSPSCTLLVLNLEEELGLETNQEEAELLMLGLCTDTGFFRHLDEKSSYVFEAASKLIQSGVSPKKTFMAMYGGKSFNSRIHIGRILSRAEGYFGNRLIISYETFEELQSLSAQDKDSDSLYQLLQSIEGVEAIAIIRQEFAGNGTVGLRSKKDIDVAKIAGKFPSGGGHKNAAGFFYEGTISQIKQNIIETFSVAFN